MQKHTKVYMDYFDFKVAEEVMCEACTRPAQDVHHIHGRGKDKDVIDNLIALCRKCHDKAHQEKISKSDLEYFHKNFIAGNKKQFIL